MQPWINSRLAQDSISAVAGRQFAGFAPPKFLRLKLMIANLSTSSALMDDETHPAYGSSNNELPKEGICVLQAL
jgi:hypothetical protein